MSDYHDARLTRRTRVAGQHSDFGESDVPNSADAVQRAVMDALRTAREPVRESVLHERVLTRGVDVSPEAFVQSVERLATLGHVHVSFERGTSVSDPAPFQPRYFRSVD